MSRVHRLLLNVRDKYYRYNNLNSKYKFINNLQGKEKYLIVLAGYKKNLYSYVFSRLEKYLPGDIDVCIVSSGVYDEELCNIAIRNQWSYLSIEKNKIAIAQNIAINLNDIAKYIYKMDEDIFVTEGVFEKMFDTYVDVKKNGKTDIGFVAPVIPLNGFGYMKVLEHYDIKEEYCDKFGKTIYSSRNEMPIISNPDVAKFFWGDGNYVPNLDKMNEDFSRNENEYSICPIRFSIGFIMFEKSLWNEMGMFRQTMGSGLGNDETQICAFCVNSSKPIIVTENSVVGHFSFGPQTKSMTDFLETSTMDYYKKV